MIREDADGVVIDILVVPRASRTKVGPVRGDRLKVSVTAPPVDGKANAAVVELLAKTLRRPRSAVEVVSGESSRRKSVRVRGLGRTQAMAAIGGAP